LLAQEAIQAFSVVATAAGRAEVFRALQLLLD